MIVQIVLASNKALWSVDMIIIGEKLNGFVKKYGGGNSKPGRSVPSRARA
jgi:hypothetical protein